VVETWAAKPVEDLSGSELLDGILTLLDAGTRYYTAVQSVIPVAASSEILFQAFYNRLVRRAGDPPAQTFLLGYDSEPIPAEKSLYDLAVWTRERPELTAAITGAPSAAACRVAADRGPACRDGTGAVAGVAHALPAAPRPLRACNLQSGLPDPGARR